VAQTCLLLPVTFQNVFAAMPADKQSPNGCRKHIRLNLTAANFPENRVQFAAPVPSHEDGFLEGTERILI